MRIFYFFPIWLCTGLRVNLGTSSDVIEAGSLGYMSDYIHIYSNSWGPADNGFTVAKPGCLLSQTFENGVVKVCECVILVMHASTHLYSQCINVF